MTLAKSQPGAGQTMFDNIIRELQAATDIKTVEAHGGTYTENILRRIEPPSAGPLGISTLTGLVEYIKAKDEFLGKKLYLHIVSATKVELVSDLHGQERTREKYISASADAVLGQAFQFGHYYELEEFLIKLLTLFAASNDRDVLLKYLGTITEESVRTHQDDGFTQTVTARVGIAPREVDIPSLVDLRPYRTFREIEQPLSKFLIRMKSGKDKEKPTAALFDSDGGAWKLEAIASIKTYLAEAQESEESPIPIIG